MWIIRFLNGPMAGQMMPLRKQTTLLGRSPSCDIKIASASVSKEHTRIELYDDKVVISDAGSRNGTFVNGVQVRSTKARSGDKVGMHEILFEVQNVPEQWASRFQDPRMLNPANGYGQSGQRQTRGYSQPTQGHGGHSHSGGAAYQIESQHESDELHMHAAKGSALEDLVQGKFPRMKTLAEEYLDRVVMPGIYGLTESFEFKWVLGGFMGIFILLVTALSTVPLIRILKVSLEEQSQQHALTIATTLARINRPYLLAGQDTAASVEVATSRPGVDKAYIITNMDGTIVSPSSQAGSYPDIPYVNEGRKRTTESVSQVDGDTVVALVPIMIFNQDAGTQTVSHWAVVVYDMSALSVDNSQVLSLFITTLFIALLLGALLFMFLYRIFETPIKSLNRQLDTALKEGHETIQIGFQFPPMQLLTSNISSALSRAVNGSGEAKSSTKAMEHDRSVEMTNLVELIGFAAMGIRANDLAVCAVNQSFESRIAMSAAQLTTLNINQLNDQALKLSVKDLIERVDANPDQMASNNLEFSGLDFQVVAQAVYGTSSIAYYLIVLLPKGEG
jgi:hypothetical protein